MSRLSEYQTLSEKNKHFFTGDTIVNTKQEFNELWRELSTLYNKEKLFRGVGEAKYKLYTSSQRFWMAKEVNKQTDFYHQFIKRLIAESRKWNQSTISKLLEASGISNDVFAYLSYMQHFRVPTPLLDFSYNPFIGLFFAVDSLQEYPSDKIIDNYCALYIADTSNRYYHDMGEALEMSLKGNNNQEDVFYDSISSHPIQLIETDNPVFRVLNNTNIINQEGLFFYNNHSVYPIEDVYYQNIENIRNLLNEEEFNQKGYTTHFARCINIHKGLKEYILAKLETQGINSYYIYPKIENLADYATKKALAYDDTNTIFELDEAKSYIAKARTKEAIDILMKYSQKNRSIQLNETIILASSFNNLKQQYYSGVIDYEVFAIESNKIAAALLEIIAIMAEEA